MDLLIAIKQYCLKLIEYGFYPKTKAPSVGKLEKMAELCFEGKYRKLSRYIPDSATDEQQKELIAMLDNIKEIVKKDKKTII